MRTIEEHLRERITKAAQGLNFSKLQLEELQKYLVNECDEEGFLKGLQSMDISVLPKSATDTLKTSYESLKKHKVEEYLDKFIKILLRIDEKNSIQLFGRWEYTMSEDLLQKFIKCGANPAAIINYRVEFIHRNEYYITLQNMESLNKFYEPYESNFKEAFELGSTNTRFCLAAFLSMKDSKRYGEYLKYLENSIKKSLQGLFINGRLSEAEIENLCKYLDGGLFITDKIVVQLKPILSAADIDMYLLKFLLATAYMVKETSNVAKRFIKLTVLLSYKEAFDKIFEFLRVDHKLTKKEAVIIQELSEKIKIPEEYLIAWMGSYKDYSGYRFKNELIEKAKDKRKEFEKAIKLANNVDSAYLTSILWSTGEGDEFLQQAEEKYLDEFLLYMNTLNVPTNTSADFIEYLKGNKELEYIKDIARNLMNSNTGYYQYYGAKHLDMLMRLRDKSKLFQRTVVLYSEFYNYSLLCSLARSCGIPSNSKGLTSFISLLRDCGVKEESVLYYTIETAVNSYSQQEIQEAKTIIEGTAAENRSVIEGMIESSSAQGRVLLLEALYNNNKVETIGTLIKYMYDTSKAVKETIIELLGNHPEAIPHIAPQLAAKKQGIRELAIKILAKVNNDEAISMLRNALVVEKNEKIKSLLAKTLNLEEAVAATSDKMDFEDYCKSIIKRSSKSTLNWLDFPTLPKVRLKDEEDLAKDDIIMALLIAYASNGTIVINLESKSICETLNEKDIAELAIHVLQRWLENGAESKKKWVLAFSAIHGDYRVIELLKKYIEEWPLKARGAIACEAVRALALNGSSSALIIVDGISRKFKFKQVKEAASEALIFAAEQLGIDKEELSDSIVPTLGFDIRGERSFNYGERKFTTRLSTDLSLEVYEDSGKQIKNLPPVGKKDDHEKAAAALEEFKVLKKQLKNTVAIQGMRLELALSANRLWKKDAWTKLFVENPIMHQFAIGLIWGIYEANKLIETFRYMEDGTLNTKDEEEYDLLDGCSIGLVHPIELSEEDIELWKEQLENYEIRQPFEQITRSIYRTTEEEKEAKNVERFGGIIINSLSLLGKITSFGWYRGSVVDAGGFYDFYKEDKNHGIGAELEFSGTYVGCEGEEVTIYGLTFYNAGTIERGSYMYDSVKEENLIRPGQVPARLFSEILYSVDRSLASKIGFDENWRRKK